MPTHTHTHTHIHTHTYTHTNTHMHCDVNPYRPHPILRYPDPVNNTYV